MPSRSLREKAAVRRCAETTAGGTRGRGIRDLPREANPVSAPKAASGQDRSPCHGRKQDRRKRNSEARIQDSGRFSSGSSLRPSALPRSDSSIDAFVLPSDRPFRRADYEAPVAPHRTLTRPTRYSTLIDAKVRKTPSWEKPRNRRKYVGEARRRGKNARATRRRRLLPNPGSRVS